MKSIQPKCLGVFGLFLVCSALLLVPADVHGQVLYGSLAGNVVDSSGARVPGAEVKIVNPRTNYTMMAITNELGSYLLQNVPDGTYTLSIGMTGFREYVAQDVVVKVGNVTRQNVVLQIGQLADTVTVTGAATALQTDTTDVRIQLETKEITDLPLGAYRNYQALINLTPGATPAAFQNAVTDTPMRALTTNVNGTARNNNNTRIDGAQSINIWLPHHSGYVPPTETIEVVNVSTNNFDAEQGFAGGAAATVITKSGTNNLHGSLFALHENESFNARDYFLVGKKPNSSRNIDGGTIGGPIVKDKLFFFAGFEAYIDRVARTTTATVATAAQRAGDFSGFSTTIFDPATGNPDGTGRTAFPGNRIPASRLSAAALKMQDLIPLPNIANSLTSNYQISGTESVDRYNTDLKFDWYRTEKHRVWGKWSYMDATVAKDTVFGEGGGGAVGGGGDGEGLTDVKVYGIGHSWSLGPKFLVDGNWGLNDMDQAVLTSDIGLGNFGQDVLGIPGTNQTDNQSCPEGRCGGIPRFSIDGFSGFGQVDGWSPLFRDEDSYSFTQNFSLSKKNHELRWGYDVVKLNLTHWQPEIGDGPRGGFNFGQSITALAGGAPGTDQNAYASFLLGLPSSMGKSLQWELMTTREWQHAFYFRDRWQATPNLTLTLGVRYEYYPLVTREDRAMESLDFQTLKLRLDNDISVSKSLFAPRVGLAYRFGDSNVFRMGYGITYDPLPFGRPLRGFYPLTVAASFPQANPFDPFRTLAQGIPLFVGPPAGSSVIDLPGFVEQRSMPGDKINRGYIQSWNFVYERKLPSQFVVSTGYVGTQTVHQLADRNLNWGPPGTGTAGRLYFPQFGRTANTLYWDGQLSGNYHSLQVALNRRYTNGLFVKGAYTYSKAISMTDDDGWAGVGWNDPSVFGRNRSATGYNRPHMLQLASVYELPWGKNLDGFAGKLARGWQMNGIFSVNQQTPFTVSASGTPLNATANSQTADQIGPLVNLGGIGTGNPYYDRNSFLAVDSTANTNRRRAVNGVCQHLSATGTVTSTSPANDCYGNTGRNIVRGPTWVNLDFSVFRHFRITENHNLEFRMEAFNFANNPKFNNPNGNVSSSAFMYITSTSGNSSPRVFRFGLRYRF